MDENITYLPALYLLQNFQRVRYGRIIIDNLISFLKENNSDEIVLLAHKDAFWAISFYQKNSFEIISYEHEEIKLYRNCLLENYALRNTVLMRRILR